MRQPEGKFFERMWQLQLELAIILGLDLSGIKAHFMANAEKGVSSV